METQVIETELAPFTGEKRLTIIASLLAGALWTAVMAFWNREPEMLHLQTYSPDWWSGYILPHVFAGILFASIWYFFAARRIVRGISPTRIKILVLPDQVTCFYQTAQSKSWKWKRTVRKGMVRTILSPRGGGISLSERSQFGARMLGFVAIPNTFPEFEELKAMLESWRIPETTTE